MLETQRLRLVPLSADHFEAVAALHADPEVARFLDGAPLDRGEAWRRLAMHVGHWTMRGYGAFACILKSSGEVVGRCGPWLPEGWPALEIGYAFSRAHWGNGYASEAAIACARHAYQALRAPKVISLVQHHNLRSQRVAERGGAKVEGEVVLRGHRLRIFTWPEP
jgi:RimJ/RimL family protein N-acetyltransferase